MRRQMPEVVVAAHGEVGVEILEFLASSFPGDIALCLTIPGSKAEMVARSNGIQTEHWGDQAAAAEVIKSVGADFGILAWWPFIVKEPLLSAPRLGWVNTHPSFLPYGRGKHYNFWTIVDQTPFGVSLHWVDAGIDTGDIIAQRKIDYDWTDTGESLYMKAQAAMPTLFRETYESLRDGSAPRTQQNPCSGTAHKGSEIFEVSTLPIDDIAPIRSILNLIRARTFMGHPACTFNDTGRTYEVRVSIREVGQLPPFQAEVLTEQLPMKAQQSPHDPPNN